MNLIWACIDEVLPNPLNPRKDYSTKSSEMQRIIKEKGWETGITCYKKESKYVILSGHRRWYAAKELDIIKVPVIIVNAPKSKAEELERLGSVQGGKVDWSVYEWAKYTYEMWILWEKCSYQELAIKMGVSSSVIASRIKVFVYYPHDEIEDNLEKGVYSLSVLYYLRIWLEKLKEKKPALVEQYEEKMIRKTMLRKIEMKLVNVIDLKNDIFIDLSSDEQLRDFLMHQKKKLSHALKEVSVEDSKYRNTSRVNAQIKKIDSRVMRINRMGAENMKDKKELLNNLDKLRSEIISRQKELEEFLNTNNQL